MVYLGNGHCIATCRSEVDLNGSLWYSGSGEEKRCNTF